MLLNFWASWCVPCREEMPAMEKLYQEYKDKNFVILAVAVKDRKQDAIDFVKELKLTYPIALDPDAQVGTAIRRLGIARDLSNRSRKAKAWRAAGDRRIGTAQARAN